MNYELIKVCHVSKTFGKVEALKDVSFSVKEGEIFGLIGPDGAGKTTMFRILATLLLPDGARKAKTSGCRVCGFDTKSQMAQIRAIEGYMPGRFSLYQDLTVEENLRFFATLFGTTVEAGYDGIRDIYQQIEPFKKRRAGKLSGGMKQKLALCCALIHNPRVLLLDEPTTGVDPVSRKEFWAMIDKLKERGITVIAATPYLDEIRHCDRVAYLSEGEVKGIGTADGILTEFKDVFCPTPLHDAGGQVQTDNDVIVVDDLMKTFGTFHAVNHVSFRVHRGEIFGFLGANGAGKTTTMRILSGLSQPSGGKATVAGFDCATQYEQVKKHIGYMSQRFSLYNDMTIQQNIQLFGGIYGMSDHDVRERGEQMLRRLGLWEKRGEFVGSLPLGWKQKLAFSVSILHQPEVVFLDEPTGGVDPKTRQQFWELIYAAAHEGITVFVTTHYMDEAEYCDRISIMVDGEVRAMGTPKALTEEFHQPDMDHVFTYLARQAKRS